MTNYIVIDIKEKLYNIKDTDTNLFKNIFSLFKCINA